MSRSNFHVPPVPLRTASGAPVSRQRAGTPETQLMRLLATAMLWQDNYYVNGKTVADQIKELVPQCRPEFVAAAAVHARHEMNIRHAPLMALVAMSEHAEHRALLGRLIPDVINRPDEITEFMSLYWGGSDKTKPIAKQIKLGLGRAFSKFDEYQLSKWNKNSDAIKLRDVLFMVHAKPRNPGKGVRNAAFRKSALSEGAAVTDTDTEVLFNRLAQDELEPAGTWEELLSAGADPKATFESLMLERKLGALAFLKNLRNMQKAGVDRDIIKAYSETAKIDRVMPYRFISAARAVPGYEDILEPMMFRAIEGMPQLAGRTLVCLDVSGSMDEPLDQSPEKARRRAAMRRAGKDASDDLKRMDAACGLGVLLRELCEEVSIYSFSWQTVLIPPRRGFALVDAIVNSQLHQGTPLAKVAAWANEQGYDRVVFLTDEQDSEGGRVADAKVPKAYMINVAPYKHSVTFGSWVNVSGFSEAVLDWIIRFEKDEAES